MDVSVEVKKLFPKMNLDEMKDFPESDMVDDSPVPITIYKVTFNH